MENDPTQLVARFLDEYRAGSAYSRELIDRLARLAISQDLKAAESATRALFTGLVERLADSFEPEAVTLYNRVFSQVIHICRKNPDAELLDRRLEEFGLRSEDDLIARAENLRRVEPMNSGEQTARKPQRVIVLSRVTLGADVAVTSVILERLKREFPGADIVLLGGSKTGELFGGDPRVRISQLGYGRADKTISRLLAWTRLVDCVRELTDGLNSGDYLVVDPDSRLTQLGLLPVTPSPSSAAQDQQRRNYLFFPSREYRSSESQSLGQLTSRWLDEVLGKGDRCYPTLGLRSEDIETATLLSARLKRGRPIVAMNFGVGENPMKRASDAFEVALVAGLIQRGAAIILDKGAGEEESRRADSVLQETTRIERNGRRLRAVEIDEESLKAAVASPGIEADILVWNGRIGILAALIARSSLYIGYDSAGGHIAAALGVPCIDVFTGSSSPRFVERWTPCGKSETRVVTVAHGVCDELVSNVLSAAREMLRL